MQFSVHYNSDFKYLNEVDEVIFDSHKNGLAYNAISEKLPEIVKSDAQRIVINFATNFENDISEAIPHINKLKQVHPNLMVQIDYYTQKDLIDLFKDNEIPFMLSNFINNRTDFYQVAHMGVAEIYIAEDLCFCMPQLKKIKDECGVRTRVFPDVSQIGKKWNPPPEITSFFIRPEDIHLYEPFVDTMEFFTRDKTLSTIFRIYKQEKWEGNLCDIIAGITLAIPGTAIPPHFGLTRINCQKKCMFNQCSCCENIQKLAEAMRDAGIVTKYPKKKFESTAKEEEENG